jgi:hypothetical protein
VCIWRCISAKQKGHDLSDELDDQTIGRVRRGGRQTPPTSTLGRDPGPTSRCPTRRRYLLPFTAGPNGGAIGGWSEIANANAVQMRSRRSHHVNRGLLRDVSQTQLVIRMIDYPSVMIILRLFSTVFFQKSYFLGRPTRHRRD